MNEGKISDEVLAIIKENTKDKEIISNFLIDLICEESRHQSNWKFKGFYKEIIENRALKWKEKHED